MEKELINTIDLNNKNYLALLLKGIPYSKVNSLTDIEIKNELLKDKYTINDIIRTTNSYEKLVKEGYICKKLN